MDYKYFSNDEYKRYKVKRVNKLWEGLIMCDLECHMCEIDNEKISKECYLSFAIGSEFSCFMYANRVSFHVVNNEIFNVEVIYNYINTEEKFDLIPKDVLIDLINRISENKIIRFTLDTISKNIIIEKIYKEGTTTQWILDEENIILL